MKKLILLTFVSFLLQGCFVTYLPKYDNHRHKIFRKNLIPYRYYRHYRNTIKKSPYDYKRW